MVDDRLHELKFGGGMNIGYEEKEFSKNPQDVHIAFDLESEENEALPFFQKKQEKIQEWIGKMNMNSDDIYALKEKQRRCTVQEEEKRIRNDIQKRVEANQGFAKQIKEELDRLSKDTATRANIDANDPTIRMQESMLHSLTNKFQGTMQKFQEYQLEYQKTVRDKVRRQIREVDEDISEDKLKELENNPEAVSEMMSQKLGLPHYRLRNEFSDIQEKYEAIKQLESSVRMAYQMMQDLAILVHAQGEQIGLISENISKAQNYIQKAEKNMVSAKKHHQASRKVV